MTVIGHYSATGFRDLDVAPDGGLIPPSSHKRGSFFFNISIEYGNILEFFLPPPRLFTSILRGEKSALISRPIGAGAVDTIGTMERDKGITPPFPLFFGRKLTLI